MECKSLPLQNSLRTPSEYLIKENTGEDLATISIFIFYTMKKVQEFQFFFSLTPPELVWALGALSLKENYSITKQREWQSLSFKYRYYHYDFQIMQFDDVPSKMRQFSIFSAFNFKQWFQNICHFWPWWYAGIFFNCMEPIFVCEHNVVFQQIFWFAKKKKRKENEEKWKERETWAP